MTISRRELRASLSVQGIPTERIDALYGPERAPRARRTGPTPEGKVLRDCKAYLRTCLKVAWFARINSGRIEQSKYSPYELFVPRAEIDEDDPLAWEAAREEYTIVDIIGQFTLAYGGRPFGVELKAGKAEPTRAQSNFLRLVADNGGLAFVAWSRDDVASVFDRLEVSIVARSAGDVVKALGGA